MNKRKAHLISRGKFYDLMEKDYTSLSFITSPTELKIKDKSLAGNKDRLICNKILSSGPKIISDLYCISNQCCLDIDSFGCCGVYTFQNGLHGLVCTACVEPGFLSKIRTRYVHENYTNKPIYVIFVIYHDGNNIRAFVPWNGNFNNRLVAAPFAIHNYHACKEIGNEYYIRFFESYVYKDFSGLQETLPDFKIVCQEIEKAILVYSFEWSPTNNFSQQIYTPIGVPDTSPPKLISQKPISKQPKQQLLVIPEFKRQIPNLDIS